MIEIRVNGRPTPIATPVSVSRLLEQLGYQDAFVAVALDRTHVRRRDFDSTMVLEHADVEILAPMAGG